MSKRKELMDRIKKNSSIKEAALLEDSIIFEAKDISPTSVPMLNIALGGALDGGIAPGATVFAGPSKSFKSLMALICAKAFMDKHEDAVLLFYDSEFGTPQGYFESLGVDTDRVLHIPLTDVEELKFDMVKQLTEFKRTDKVIIILDSIGNLASKKEVEDTLGEKSTADMTRAKQIKSLFRMITPYLTLKEVPLIVVNHTYQTLALYSQQVQGGGTGVVYAPNSIFFMGKQQEKEGADLTGFNFIINIEKSRFVRERSKFPITVLFDGGVNKWSGLLEMAMESGHVIVPNKGWYARVDQDTGEIETKRWRARETNSAEFWVPVLKHKSFNDWITNKYQISANALIADDSYGEVNEEDSYE